MATRLVPHPAQAQIYPPWAASYLDYMQLKGRIKDILEVKDNAEAASVLDARKHIFQVCSCSPDILPVRPRRGIFFNPTSGRQMPNGLHESWHRGFCKNGTALGSQQAYILCLTAVQVILTLRLICPAAHARGRLMERSSRS